MYDGVTSVASQRGGTSTPWEAGFSNDSTAGSFLKGNRRESCHHVQYSTRILQGEKFVIF